MTLLLALRLIYRGCGDIQFRRSHGINRWLINLSTMAREEIALKATHWLTHAWRYHVNPRWIKSDLVDCLWVAARLATARQAYVRAATLFGLAEQVSRRIRYPLVEPVQSLVNAALATVQTALEPAAFAEAFAAGQQMALADVFATILSSLY